MNSYIVQDELIPYSTATQMAVAFEDAIKKIEEAQALVASANEQLNSAFQTEGNSVKFEASIRSAEYRDAASDIHRAFKQLAWRHLINKLGVKNVMSSKRQNELNEILYSQRLSDVDQLPEITASNINDVIAGYCGSAEELLHEAIREEYDYFKGSRHSKLKTAEKNLYKLDRKIIVEFAVEFSFGKFDVAYRTRPHLTSIDNVFHLLDGKGAVKGYSGPLVDSIKRDGEGETEYFKFKCFKNRNLHIEFKRLDLLERFNLICGRNRLPSRKAS